MDKILPSKTALELAKQVLAIEAEAIQGLSARLGQGFLDAVALLLNCKGRVIVSGIGKSGHIARKIASTMASTGTPAFFVHPAEASHGDLRRTLTQVGDIKTARPDARRLRAPAPNSHCR